jgi:Xaa-Pro aminopeptidase
LQNVFCIYGKKVLKMSKLIEPLLNSDAMVITDPYNMRYLSGFRGGEGILYISGKSHVLITDSRYTEAASRESEYTVEEESRNHRREAIIASYIRREKIRTLGFEDLHMRCAEYEKFRETMPEDLQLIPLGGSVNALREIKSDEELRLLARAEQIGDEAFSDLLGILHVGMTEREVAAELEYRMKKHGAQGFSFDTIAASGPNSSMPHAIPGERKLSIGDFLTLDFGCLYEGYCSDMTRTVAIGDVSDRQREIYDTVLAAQKAALKGLHAGMTGEEGDALARDVIREAGYGDCFGHALGHSVGLFIHEEPRLGPGSSTILKKGMIETVEPGIYVPGFCGVRIEDMVVITEDGAMDLTHSPKELIVIGG